MDSEILDNLPQYVTVPKLERATGIGGDVWRDLIAGGQLRAIRTSPGGWIRVDVAEAARLLNSLGPNGPCKNSPTKH